MRIRVLLLLLTVLTVVGCAGGGGGGGPVSLRYITDWTNRNRPGVVTGLSQRVQLFDQDGALATSLIVNQDANGKMTVNLPQVNPGTYRLLVQLMSERDANGSIQGIAEALLQVGKGTVFETSVGDDVAGVTVTPSNRTIQVQQTGTYYAYGRNTQGIATFIAPGTISWSQLGDVVTIDPNEGIATGITPGTGSIRARHDPSGILGSAGVTVTQNNVQNTKWTILVFLNAANDLQQFSPLNVNQMERVAQNNQVRFVVQWKQVRDASFSPNPTFEGTRRYLIKPDATNDIRSELIQDMGQNVDMGDWRTLRDFIAWGKANYPADRYGIVIWNHGNGWRDRMPFNYPTRGVSYDDQTNNWIDTWQLASSLGTGGFEFVAWDASLMQMAEVAFEIKDQTKYIIGSEESPPGEGYPYDRIFDDFRDNPDAPTLQLTKAFVDGMLEVPGYANRKITQSVIDSTKLDALASAASGLANAMIANVPNLTTLVPQVRQSAQSYGTQDGIRFYRDFYDVCLRLEAGSTINAIDDAAAAVRTAIDNAVVWEGHNTNSPNSHGIAIDFSSANTYATYHSVDYPKLRWSLQTTWNEWLAVAP